MKSLLTIGNLIELEVYDPKTDRTAIIHPKGKILGWDPRKNKFCIVIQRSGKTNPSGQLSGDIIEAHTQFHAAPPKTKPFIAENPEPVGKLRKIGLLKSLVYQVQKKIKSPSKKRHHWHHAFGDTGHKGGDDYPTSVMPVLMEDSKGNLFIKRKKGNIFNVDEWLRG